MNHLHRFSPDSFRTLPVALLIFGLMVFSAAGQQGYSLFPLEGAGVGINNRGQVVGWLLGTNGTRSLINDRGTITFLETLGGPRSYGYVINDRGDVAGVSETFRNSPGRHVFLFRQETMIDITALAGGTDWWDAVYGLNNRGEVVGIINGRGFLYRDGGVEFLNGFIPTCINTRGDVAGHGTNSIAVRYSRGTLVELGSLGEIGSVAHGINDNGDVVGVSPVPGQRGGAFLYRQGKMINLGSPDDSLPISWAGGINNRGNIIGYIYSIEPNGIYHAFLYRDGQMHDLNTLLPKNAGVTLEMAMGINDSDEIVAIGYDTNRTYRTYFLRPDNGAIR